MELFKTTVVIDKAISKELRKHITTPFEKKLTAVYIVLCAIVLILATTVGNYQIAIYIILIILLFLFMLFIGGPYTRASLLLYRTYKLRRDSKISSGDYVFDTSFSEAEFLMKDTLEYNDNVIVKMKYKDIRYFIETKAHYVLLPKSWFGLGGLNGLIRLG